MIRLGKVSVLSHPKKHTLEHAYTHTHTPQKEKSLAGWLESLVPLLPAHFPTSPLSCVLSHEHSMHQNLTPLSTRIHYNMRISLQG